MSAAKFFIKTYGCQSNEADSLTISRFLHGLGLSECDTEDLADMILVNTCAIREKAEEKLFSYLGTLAEFRKKKPYLKIGVVGCVASYRRRELFERFDHVNLVYGSKEDRDIFFDRLEKIVAEIKDLKSRFEAGEKVWGGRQDRGLYTVNPCSRTKNLINLPRKISLSSGINITYGCNNYCSYCIVPFTRGPERSFSFAGIVERVKSEVAAGAKEIFLLGQNVNSYRDPDTGSKFPELLKSVAKIPGDFWIRFMSPHPKDVTREMVDVMAENPDKICQWIHLPLQSGSDEILRRMSRGYSGAEFLDKVEMIRKILPNVFISTDIIVGFPGEEETEYRETRRVMDEASFGLIYSFIYSPRKHTPAASMGDPCSIEVKHERLSALQKHAQELALKENKKFVGQTVRVLVEKHCDDGRLLGKTSGGQRVFFEGTDDHIEKFTKIKLIEAFRSYITGIVS